MVQSLSPLRNSPTTNLVNSTTTPTGHTDGLATGALDLAFDLSPRPYGNSPSPDEKLCLNPASLEPPFSGEFVYHFPENTTSSPYSSNI